MSRRSFPGLSSAHCIGAPRAAASLAARSPWTVCLHAEPRDLDICSRALTRCRHYSTRKTVDDRNAPAGGATSRIASLRHFSHIPPRRRPAVISTGETTHHGSPPPRSHKNKKRQWIVTAGAAVALLTTYHYLLADPSAPDKLNKERFTPCTVVSREPVSPTAFVLTVRVPNPSANRAIVANAHEYGLWSVEIKQPQLQIARNYTPLPPRSPPPRLPDAVTGDDDDSELLRFFVRRYETGEVSKYLSRLAPGDKVEIRGPHLGFDLGARLGLGLGDDDDSDDDEDKKPRKDRHVIFLAGGTGIAPAMQTARRLLVLPDSNSEENGKQKVSVQILWANRATADCVGCTRINEKQQRAGTTQLSWGETLNNFFLFFFLGSRRSTSQDIPFPYGEKEEHPSLIIAQLQELQARYASAGSQLEVTCAVDEEKGSRKFAAQDIAEAVNTATARARRWGGSSPSLSSASMRTPADAPADSALTSCFYHSQRQLYDSTEELDAEEGVARRRCTCDGGAGGGKAGGRNLFIISGPEGFVSSYVGPKVWARGAERQGPVEGVVAELIRRDPALWGDWLVLKQ